MQAGQEPIETLSDKPAAAGSNDPVCQYLLEKERLKASDLKRAVTYRDQHGGDLVSLLVRLGLVSERDVAEAWRRQLPGTLAHAPQAQVVRQQFLEGESLL